MRDSCPHRVTALTQGSSSVGMTVTNSTNISNLDCFNLVLCVNPDTVVTGEPMPYTLTINGTPNVPLLNKYTYPIYSDKLCTRKLYHGAYVNNGTTSHVILWDTPCCKCDAIGGTGQ